MNPIKVGSEVFSIATVEDVNLRTQKQKIFARPGDVGRVDGAVFDELEGELLYTVAFKHAPHLTTVVAEQIRVGKLEACACGATGDDPCVVNALHP